MIQPVVQRFEGAFEIGKIHDPAGIGANRTADVNLDTKGMTVHASALVPLGHVRQPVSRLYLKDSKNIHGKIVPPASQPRNPLFVKRIQIVTPHRLEAAGSESAGPEPRFRV